ncbi:MAG: hypothetical protein M1815_002083 [Lichina confinis]|nr:MAG: hypothetical protein M1815_002083 [Lichina confinis]
MAETMRPISTLPHVKCSSCNVEIAIAAMGDHVCVKVADSLPVPTPWRTKPTLPGVAMLASGGPSRNTLATNQPFLRQNSASSQQLKVPMKSSTLPYRRSPSPAAKEGELTNLDCAFPPFPRSRTVPDLSADQHLKPFQAFDRWKLGPSPAHAPLSPKTYGGENVMRKMSDITPGPFAVKNPSSVGSPRSRELPPSEARSVASTGRSAPAGGALPDPNALEERDNLHQAMHTAFEQSRGAVQFKGPFGGTDLHGFKSTAAKQQKMLASATHSSQGGNASLSPPRTAEGSPHARGVLSDQTYSPMRKGSIAVSYEPAPPSKQQQQQQQQRQQQRRPTEPLISPGSTSGPGSFDVGRNPSAMVKKLETLPLARDLGSLVAPANDRWDQRPRHWRDIPQADASLDAASVDQPNHAPSQSWSSGSSSFISEGHTSSSTLTPPMDASPEMLSQKTYGGREGPAAVRLKMSPSTTLPLARNNGLPSSAPSPSMTMDGPSIVNPAPLASRKQQPESPLDPALQGNMLSSTHNVPITPRSLPPHVIDMSRRPSKGSKGNCRGCKQEIVGKSVSSSDGQLTGRYHRECLVCQTCRASFHTTTFYVLDNQPHCERHYHELNNSLCRACDSGIEGLYLETDGLAKYHPDCLNRRVASPDDKLHHTITIPTKNAVRSGRACRRYQYTVKGDRDGRLLDVRRMAQLVEATGAGEMLLHRIIDRDSTAIGLDLGPIDTVQRTTKIPRRCIKRDAGNPRLFRRDIRGQVVPYMGSFEGFPGLK